MSKILDGNPIKKAHMKIEYTDKMLDEFEKCADKNNGHMFFITNYGHIKHPEKGMIVYQPFDYQIKLLHVYHNYRFSISMMGRQMGKALAGDTKIMTPAGFKNMEDLKVGEYVYDEQGKEVIIKNKTQKQIDRNCYSIYFSHGETIVADENHQWAINSNEENNIYSTLELYNNQNLSLEIKKPKPLEIKKQYVPVHPYSFGMWVCDGFPDTFEIYNTIFDYDLHENKKTYIPTEYIYNSLYNRVELIRGIIDSSKTKMVNEDYEFSTNNENLINNIKLVLSTLGITSTIKNDNTGIDTLRFSFSNVDKFKPEENYDHRFFINETKDTNNNFLITKIEKTESVPVYCIEVDNPTHLFLAGETLIPTHNCTTGDTKIKIRNKKTGEIKNISIGEFHKLQENSSKFL